MQRYWINGYITLLSFHSHNNFSVKQAIEVSAECRTQSPGSDKKIILGLFYVKYLGLILF